MIIKIKLQDIWDQFVYFRKNGRHQVAFSLLRRNNNEYYTNAILASVAHRKYTPRIGDIIMLDGSTLGMVWSQQFENEYKEIPVDR